MAKLLVVDDEESICWGVRRMGDGLGLDVVTASSAEQALQMVDSEQPDAIVLDVHLPGMNGLSAIDCFREHLGRVPIIIITAYGDLETAVEAVRQGAFEYIVKPFDLDRLERALTRALAKRDVLAQQPFRQDPPSGLIGRSPAMQEVFTRIALAAASDAGVLICGESGAGKELAARAIHRHSSRAQGPFVAVNIAALSPAIAESELFGHARGAFTGAENARVGLLLQASGGTLFLDEVADIPPATQVKLLRALEQGEVLPVGADQPVKTNFRIVSATHQNLLDQVRAGTFRHDLYFRLGAFRIDMPSLRERREDIAELAEHFLRLAARPAAEAPCRFSELAAQELKRRPWLGNVRELRNAVEHAVIVARSGVIEPDHLPQVASESLHGEHDTRSPGASIMALVRQWAETQLATPADATDLYEQMLQLIEPPLLAAALEKHRGQCAAAARQLGLHRTTLRKKMDDYGMG